VQWEITWKSLSCITYLTKFENILEPLDEQKQKGKQAGGIKKTWLDHSGKTLQIKRDY
jgi:hypothetical protein